jgi:two-component system nitrate/nitrite response regulator NarL
MREGLERTLIASDFRVLVSAPNIDLPILSALPPDLPLLLIIEVSKEFYATLSQIACFKERYPTARVAVLTHPHQHQELPDLVLAYRVGANAYFVNVATSDVLIKSLELVMLGETILPSAILTLLCSKERGFDNEENVEERDNRESIAKALPEAKDNCARSLSARQKSILHCLIEGDSNKTIARKIHITEATVKVHLKTILCKIRVQNRTQAAIWAMNNGSSIWVKETDSCPVAEVVDRTVF